MSTFSTLIAKRYLSEGHGVDLGEDYDHSDGITMGSVLWPVIPARRTAFGGYHHLDTQGLAILLNYRRLKDPTQTGCNTVETPADCLSVGEVLKRSPEDLKGYIQGRIVLIGTTALAFPTDRWVTPFTTTRSIEDQAPGVFLQAQMISQLINAELGSPPRLLYTDWPEWKKNNLGDKLGCIRGLARCFCCGPHSQNLCKTMATATDGRRVIAAGLLAVADAMGHLGALDTECDRLPRCCDRCAGYASIPIGRKTPKTAEY